MTCSPKTAVSAAIALSISSRVCVEAIETGVDYVVVIVKSGQGADVEAVHKRSTNCQHSISVKQFLPFRIQYFVDMLDVNQRF